MQLFYNPEINLTDSEIQFSKDESRHIVKVLRKSIGDNIHITNGSGTLFISELVSNDYKNCRARIIETETQSAAAYQLHMAVAPTKMNDRFEWFLEKATEIGVSSITPIFCDNSERKVVKLERFEKILQAAMKQSLRYYMPQLNEPIGFRDFISDKRDGQLYIAHCEDDEKISLNSILEPNSQITILIGPEGDFSVNEIETALKSGYLPVSLGDFRLRTETAAIVACHTVALKHQS